MARKVHYELEKETEPQLDIAPLIDVSFLLLIYFIVTSTMQPREGDLDIIFPSNVVETDDVPPPDPMSIHLREDGVILTGAEGAEEELETDVNARDCPRLLEKMRDYKILTDTAGSQPLVVVRADDNAKQQRFIDIVNVLTEVGIANVTITGFREEDEE